MIRSLQSTDAPELISLLHWMDDAPEREVFCPDARTPDDLELENAGKAAWVAADDLGNVRAFAALSPFHGGLVLEGPLCESPDMFGPLLRAALSRSDAQSVYAFCARDNLGVRAALEEAGFAPMHTTDFYRLKRSEWRPQAPKVLDPALSWSATTDARTYLELYRAAEDIWSDRLEWSAAHVEAHLRSPDLKVVVLERGGAAVGFAEVELEGELARVTYLAIHPDERGAGLGQALLRRAVETALAEPHISAVQVRAHDHEVAARTLYAHSGFTHRRSVVTYLLEPEGEEA